MKESFKLMKEFSPVSEVSSLSELYVETEPDDNLHYTDEEEQVYQEAEILGSELRRLP